LHFVTALVLQDGCLLCGLDALCNDFQAEAVRHGYKSFHDGSLCPFSIRRNVLYEAAINLKPRQRIFHQIAQ
jgi:hypothetical protein